MANGEGGQEEPAAAFPANAVHLIRATHQAHIQLSHMADQKASILMGATFVILTITIGQGHDGNVPAVPLLILSGFAFLSAVLAVTAILPSTGGNPAGVRPNLLFFGSFTAIPEEEYVDRLVAVLRDEEATYRTMLRDIHQNGTVLRRRKYRLVALAYRLFLVGLTASFVAFLIRTAAALA